MVVSLGGLTIYNGDPKVDKPSKKQTEILRNLLGVPYCVFKQYSVIEGMNVKEPSL